MKSTYDLFMRGFEQGKLGKQRHDLIEKAYGNVLEIGAGTGVNLNHYDYGKITSLTVSDYDLNPVLKKKFETLNTDYNLETLDVMSLPYDDQSFDTVLVTLVFCSVKDVYKGLSEIKRVLRNDGQLIFIEHVLPDHEPLISIFNMATPVWKHLAGNCHLNRDFIKSLERLEFKVEGLRKFYKTAFIGGIAYKK